MRFIVRPRHALPKIDLDEHYVVISISDPPPYGDPAKIPQRWGLQDVLRLEFFDLDPNHYKEGSDLAERAMTAQHAQAVASFIGKHWDVPVCVVHCDAAAGRSPSTAMAICDGLGLDRSCIDWRPDQVKGPPTNLWVYDMIRAALAAPP